MPSIRSNQLSRTASIQSAFTLVEVMVAVTILSLAIGMTMVVYIAAMKRAQHTELMLKGTAELRYAVDVISQAVRSAPLTPSVGNGGLQLFVPPKNLGYLVVQNGTWIDTAHTTNGWKANMKTLQVSPNLPAVVNSVFQSPTARPTGAIADSDLGTYFVTAAGVTPPKVSDLVSVNDVLTIPATSFGAAVTLTVNSVSNNAGIATITSTANLGSDVPDGAIVTISGGRELLFEVIATAGATQGDLRYYPDSRNRTKFTVLAHNIDVAPLTDPSTSTSTRTVPFVIPTADSQYVILNLQRLPAGTMVGRTVQGAQTTVYMRTNPTNP